MTTHHLKTWPEPFQAIIDNKKPWEIRFNDRNFQVDDVLHLQEWRPGTLGMTPDYTGREVFKSVIYLLGEPFAPKGSVIMTLDKMHVGPDVNPNPWEPETDPLRLKILGKAGEEAGEYITALFRSIIQGVDGTEPSTGKPNRQWLSEELADVMASSAIVGDHLDLDQNAMGERATRKYNFLKRWLGNMS